MYHPSILDPTDDIEELRVQQRYQRIYQRQLANHPQCIDPDHPGCPYCDDDAPDDPEAWDEENRL